MKKMKMIVSQNYWNKSYEHYRFSRLPETDPILKVIKKYVPETTNKTAFEMGCFPGKYLAEIGDKGYVLNGCDLFDDVETLLFDWLRSQGFKINELKKESFDFYKDRKYDLVASFGFIEHFKSYTDVFQTHLDMINNEGFLVMEFPNFKGIIQRFLHFVFDRDNFNNHILEAMDLNYYKKQLSSNFEIIYCEYIGGFDFWIDDFNKRNGFFKKIFLKLFFKTKFLWKYLNNSSYWSPYAILIAKKGRK